MSHYSGSCLCGGVAFNIHCDLQSITACHCKICAKTSGYYVMATRCQQSELSFICQDSLSWYQSSDFAKRGFCNICGASLFYKLDNADTISIMLGCLDNDIDITIAKHLFVSEKNHYYHIHDNAPQYQEFEPHDARQKYIS